MVNFGSFPSAGSYFLEVGMRFLIVALLFLSFLAHADSEPLCSAELEYLDGSYQMAILECDSPYAGKCLKQVSKSDASLDWQEVECGK